VFKELKIEPYVSLRFFLVCIRQRDANRDLLPMFYFGHTSSSISSSALMFNKPASVRVKLSTGICPFF